MMTTPPVIHHVISSICKKTAVLLISASWKWLTLITAMTGLLPLAGIGQTDNAFIFPDTTLPASELRTMRLADVVAAELTRQRILRESGLPADPIHELALFPGTVQPWHSDLYQDLQEESRQMLEYAERELDWFGNHFDGSVQNIKVDGPFREQEVFPIRTGMKISMTSLDSFLLDNGRSERIFLADHIPFETEITIEDLRPLSPEEADMKASDAASWASVTCTEPVRVHTGGLARDLRDVRSARFYLYRRNNNRAVQKITLPGKKVSCIVRISEHPGEPFRYGFTIQSDTALNDERLSGRVREICTYSRDHAGMVRKGIIRDNGMLFSTMAYKNISCPLTVDADGAPELLHDALDALNAKVKALTGTILPREVIMARDTSYAIDMTHAPSLDYILISTLEFKNDYYGNLISRLLLWHAVRGTKIKILLPGISFMLKDKDKALLNKLVASSPNILYQPFIYDKRSLHRLHRVIHSKLFITISHQQPGASLVITGGRNIKDSYLFYGLSPDYSGHPAWIQYGSEESYIYYWDLEVAIRHHEVAMQVASQFFAIWNRDRQEYFYRPASVHVAVSGKNSVLQPDTATTSIRHLLSIPYADNRQMEKLFTDMIRSAREHIRIVSPYFRLTSTLKNAFDEALDRGVKIELVTRLKLAGDNTPIIAEDVNKDSVNKFYKKMDIYAWSDPVSILHVKAMQIDSGMLYLGAANMNQRSFAHDIESGFVLYGKKPSAQFESLFENVFKKQSDRIREKQSIRWISRLIIPLFGGFF